METEKVYSPKFCFIIKAHSNLEFVYQTIKSIYDNEFGEKYIVIVTTLEKINELGEKFKEIEQIQCNSFPAYNKFPLGIPSYGIGNNGKDFQFINEIVEETKDHIDLYTILNSGDVIAPTFIYEINNSISDDPGIIGLIYWDTFNKGIYKFEEPYIRQKHFQRWSLSTFSIPKYLFSKIKLEQNYLDQITSKYIAVHISLPLVKLFYV